MIRKYRSARERGKLFLHHGGKCHLCGWKIQFGEAWDVEHRIPLAQGGEDEDHNLGLAHKKCHREKTISEAPVNAKIERIRLKHIGAYRKPSRWPKGRKFG